MFTQLALAERTSDRLMAAIQLGNASLALAAAAKLNSNLPEAEAALRHAVSELRWVLGVSAADTERLGSSKVEVSGWVCKGSGAPCYVQDERLPSFGALASGAGTVHVCDGCIHQH
jgi:hypothetical protein